MKLEVQQFRGFEEATTKMKRRRRGVFEKKKKNVFRTTISWVNNGTVVKKKK
jgi:hypothetical protein